VPTTPDQGDSAPPREIAELIAEHPSVKAAAEFAQAFAPQPDADYKWVVCDAKDQHAAVLKAFNDQDAKAASILGYLGSGAGLLSIGALTAVATDRISSAVALSGVPAFVMAVAALICAALARQVSKIFHPHLIFAVRCATECGPTAEARFVGQWFLATALTATTLKRKAKWLGRATWAFIAAVALLLLPLLVSLLERSSSQKPQQPVEPRPIIIQIPAPVEPKALTEPKRDSLPMPAAELAK
jgi:hypothetical protein